MNLFEEFPAKLDQIIVNCLTLVVPIRLYLELFNQSGGKLRKRANSKRTIGI